MRTVFALAASLCASLALSTPALAYLGSFGPNDGYVAQYGTVLGDVTYYNAGQNGANAGGGPLAPVPADTGLWSLQTPNSGGVFASAANRAAFAATYPAYPPTPANTVPIYLLGGHFPGRNADGSNLAFRNDTPPGTGAARYRYALDAYDFGGPAPASVTAGPLSVGFYFMPNPADAPPADGTLPPVKFAMTLLDSAANPAFQWGYAFDNTVVWRDSPANPWNYTAVVADQANWDGVRFDLDLSADTFGIDYYDVGTNAWSTLVPAGTPMGSAIANLTHLDWQLSDAVNIWGSPTVGGKNYFDDFSFTVVPEPATLAAVTAFLSTLAVRRPRPGLPARRT